MKDFGPGGGGGAHVPMIRQWYMYRLSTIIEMISVVQEEKKYSYVHIKSANYIYQFCLGNLF